MKVIHDAWIDCLAEVSYRDREYVASKFDNLPHDPDAYKTDEHLHSAMAFLYKHTCMPILLYSRETLNAKDVGLMYTNRSIRVTTAHALVIRLVSVGMPNSYPFVKNKDRIIDKGEVFEKEFLDAAFIRLCIVIGM